MSLAMVASLYVSVMSSFVGKNNKNGVFFVLVFLSVLVFLLLPLVCLW